jgi:hypothetical protein
VALALAVPLLTPAPVSAALKPSVACGALTNKLVGSTATSVLSKCTPAALSAGGSAVTLKTPPPGSQQGSLGTKITWKGGKGTTTTAAKFTVQKTRGACPTGTSRITVGPGTVKIVTGAAAKIIKVGEPVTATVCAFISGPKKGQVQLAPGTKYML